MFSWSAVWISGGCFGRLIGKMIFAVSFFHSLGFDSNFNFVVFWQASLFFSFRCFPPAFHFDSIWLFSLSQHSTFSFSRFLVFILSYTSTLFTSSQRFDIFHQLTTNYQHSDQLKVSFIHSNTLTSIHSFSKRLTELDTIFNNALFPVAQT